jgi:hypothetical protein
MKQLLLALLLAATAVADELIHDENNGHAHTTVTRLDAGGYRYRYVVADWTTGQVPGLDFLPKSGKITLFRDDGRPITRGFRQVKDAKRLPTFKPTFQTALDGRIEFEFVSRGAPVRGRFMTQVSIMTPWGVGTSGQHGQAWVPGKP